MRLAVSPYHVTTREPPLMAALLLADRVVTMMPAPLAGRVRDQARAAAERVPGYLSLLRSWQWTVPLWEAGVIEGSFEGHDPAEDVRSACTRIDRDDRYAPLRSLMRPGLFDTDEDYLDSLSRDLLRGGPDPAICVPVSAAMDRFALTHGLLPLRSEPSSVAQRAEERLGERAFAIAVPVLVQAGARRILETRDRLAPQIQALGRAVDATAAGEERSNGHGAALTDAARAYALAFEEHLPHLTRPGEDDDDECRVLAGTLAIVGVRLPIDAVLMSSLAAYESAAGVRNGRAASSPGPALAEHDPLAGRTFVSLIVRALGSRRA